VPFAAPLISQTACVYRVTKVTFCKSVAADYSLSSKIQIVNQETATASVLSATPISTFLLIRVAFWQILFANRLIPPTVSASLAI